MKDINIGKNIIENRHKHGITQEQLANYMGVSKASVSKWETASTYPDIALLPKLAAFFNISIDELIGYEPQLTKEAIRQLYRSLSKEFAGGNFEQAVAHCHEIEKKYYSCMPLLLQIGNLYVNHCMLAPCSEQTVKILEEAKILFRRVKNESSDVELTKQAINMEALCFLILGKPDEVRRLLEPLEISFTCPEPLLAKAFQAEGKNDKSQETLQVGMYRCICELFNLLASYMEICIDNISIFEETYQRGISIARSFHLDKLHPSIMLSFYVIAAQGFARLGKEEKALELLEKYCSVATGDIFHLKLKGDAFFDHLDHWLESTLVLGNDLPRDASIVKKSITETVSGNPAFSQLYSEPRFQNIVNKLRNNEETVI